MDQDFMNRFMPKISTVLIREEPYWRDNGYDVNRSSTQMCNLGFVLGGEGELEINGISYKLRRGCFYHITPIGSRMRLATEASNPLYYLAVHFDYRLIQWEGLELSSREAAAPLPLSHVLELDAAAHAEERFRELHQLWNEKLPGYEWRARILLTGLLDEIERMQPPASAAELRAEEAIRLAMRHVHEHYAQPEGRERMARSCSMSISYFSLLFKQYTGYSYVQYVHKVRLDKAKALLRSSSLPVSEVAREIGYEDPLYFSKLFAREVGLSPRDYRKG